MVKKVENRKYHRYEVDGMRGHVLNTTDLDVINASVDGAAIETHRRLEINREYTFKIKSESRSLRIKGRVVWAILISRGRKESKATSPVYRAGIKFIETLSEKARALQDFIEENKVKASEHRLAGVRFKISNAGNITLDYPCECLVKQIGLSGMLIETEYPLDPGANHDIEIFVGDEKLSISGKVANCAENPGERGSKYDIGIEFTSISTGDKLLDFLRKLD